MRNIYRLQLEIVDSNYIKINLYIYYAVLFTDWDAPPSISSIDMRETLCNKDTQRVWHIT